MPKWYEIKNQGPSSADVYIYEEIGENLWGEGVAAKTFVPELAALDVTEIALHINSYGGNVFDGQAIYTALKNHPATVTTYVDGVAASIASVVALAGDKIVMPANAMMMIHNPIATARWASAAELRRLAGVLDKVRDTILNVYEGRSTKTRDELAAAMDEETWLTSDQAIEYGFADEQAGEVQLAANYNLTRYRHAPAALLAPPEPIAPEAANQDSTQPGPAEDPVQTSAEDVAEERRDPVAVARMGKVLTFPPRHK